MSCNIQTTQHPATQCFYRLFGVVEDKDPRASMADADTCPVVECIKVIK